MGKRLFGTNKQQLTEGYKEQLSKHRTILPLYQLVPMTSYNWIAPNATVSKTEHLK